jgi:hypothetical protein
VSNSDCVLEDLRYGVGLNPLEPIVHCLMRGQQQATGSLSRSPAITQGQVIDPVRAIHARSKLGHGY